MNGDISRREATRIIAGTAASVLVTRTAPAQEAKMMQRAIPSSGEKLPVIGLGTWQSFDAGAGAPERAPLEEVLTAFAKRGGRVVDSSPMYGRAEAVLGDLTARLRLRNSLFLATKVWTSGREAGIRSMERSLALMKTRRIDLMQVHNLVDAQTHLATLREWKAQDRVRYIGITHYTASSHDEVARVLEREKVNFVQINYSLMEREADERLLRVAQDRGVAVIVNRPFGGGGLFGRVRGKTLPDWAAEFDCSSWAQFFLKWIVAHPAVTCAIPGDEQGTPSRGGYAGRHRTAARCENARTLGPSGRAVLAGEGAGRVPRRVPPAITDSARLLGGQTRTTSARKALSS